MSDLSQKLKIYAMPMLQNFWSWPYSTPAVKVDNSVHTLARLATVPGTLNCKGPNTADRPHRFARILETPERRVLVTADMLARIVALSPPDEPSSVDRRIDHDAALAEQKAWLDKHGLPYDVESHPGYTILRLPRCPWRPDETDGRTWVRIHPVYGVHAGCFHSKCRGKNLAALRKLYGDPDPDKTKLTDPYYLAERHIERFAVQGQRTSVWMGERLTIWGGSMWTTASDKMMMPHVSATIKQTADKAGKTLPISRKLVGDTLAAVHSLSLIPDRPAPFWVGDGPPWAAEDVIPFANGLLHLPSWLAGQRHYFMRPTPLYYNTHQLGFAFDAGAPAPTRWLQFLAELWDDTASHDLLHEWGGYCMSRDTSRQKLMMLIGEPRGGKGTICRILGEMVGGNYASPPLKSLIDTHGLAPLYGRQLVICPDAKNLPAKIVGEVCAMIKAITGEDSVLINPKHGQQFTDRLRAKLIIQSNDELAIPDHSAALQARQLFLRFDRSFLGREDTQLDAQLKAELPGIANLFLAGLRRLTERGQFSEPEASKALAAKIKKAANPIITYVSERCILDPARSIPTPDLYADHVAWAADTDSDALTPSRFAQDILATYRHLERARPRSAGKARPYHYIGIGLK